MTYDEAYAALCVNCWREKECHEDMCYCDAYLMACEGEEYDINDKGDICQYDNSMDYAIDLCC